MAEQIDSINPDGKPISCPYCESQRFYRFESFSGVDIVNIYTTDGHSTSRDGARNDAEWDGDWSCENDHLVDEDTSDLLDDLYESRWI